MLERSRVTKASATLRIMVISAFAVRRAGIKWVYPYLRGKLKKRLRAATQTTEREPMLHLPDGFTVDGYR